MSSMFMGSILKRLSLTSLLALGAGSVAISAHGQVAPWEPDLLPPNPEAGKCYGRFQIPAQFTTTEEKVLVSQGYAKIQVSQPRLSPRQEQILIKEASVRFEVRQPRFETVREQVLVRPAYEKLSVSPPQFSIVTQTIQTSTPRLVWKLGNPLKLEAQGYKVHSVADGRIRSRGYAGSTSSRQALSRYQGTATSCGDTCEIWCLVEEPGETVSFNRRVMTSSGTVQRIPVPAKYASISKQILADPGGVREIPVPAKYRTITVETLVEPGRQHLVDMPPVYGLVDKKTLIAPGRYEWRETVCAPGYVGSSTAPIHNSYGSGYSSSTGSRAHSAATHSSAVTHSSRAYSHSGGNRSKRVIIYRSTTPHNQHNQHSQTHTTSGQFGTTQSGRSYYYGTNKPVPPHKD
ncbi:MAG: hypothetical protein COA91_01010 [Robiginitomaculum sp.]|nr:MAG: hypothetical protein COA91_01010 [Robiginitomaculum sp.]